MYLTHRGWLTTLLLSACAGLASVSFAQTNAGQIAGTVTDPSGAVVNNASIRALNDQTGASYTGSSSTAGSYRLPDAAVGTYTITVAAPGFKDQVTKGVIVQIGSVTSLNIALNPGNATETVSVTTSAAGIETQSSDVGAVVTTRQIQELPLALGGLGQLRALESFVFLAPGTVGPGTATAGQGGNSAQTAGIYLSKIGGGQNFGAQVLLDGLSTQRAENGSTFDETAPSVEAISEFRVTTSTPPADLGRTSGGIENFITKSGSNQFHGTVFEIFRNTALDANDWFNKGYLANTPTYDAAGRALHARANDQKNDYGITLGGPVKIPHVYNGSDKLFFFFSFEQFRKSQAQAQASTVPTAMMRTGNFSEILTSGGGATGQTNPCTGQPNLGNEIFDPATARTVTVKGTAVQCRSPFAFGGKTNAIDPSRLTTLGKNILNAYPAPQNTQVFNNYFYRSTQTFQNTTDTIRVDDTLTDRIRAYASYSARENSVPFGNSAPLYPGPAGALLLQDFTTHYGRLGIDVSFTPTLLNTFVFGTNRLNNRDFSSELGNGVNYATQLGIPGVNSSAFPNIIPQNGESALGAALNSDHTETHFLLNDALLVQRGRHSLKFGFEYNYRQFVAKGAGNANGQFFGYLFETAAAPNGSGFGDGTGFGLAGLALGLPDYVRYITPQDPKWLSHYLSAYVQDDFKVTPHLTLNVGLRYDIDSPRTEARNQTSNFSPTAIDPKNNRPGALLFGTTYGGNKAWADTYFKNFGPRVGFAYSPAIYGGKTVLRGGGAILYAPLLYADFGQNMQQGYSYNLGVPGDGFNPALDLNKGIPAFPAPPNLDPGQVDTGNAGSPQEIEYIRPSYGRNGMISEWNLQVQQDLGADTTFTLGYIGQAGQNLPSYLQQLNNIPTQSLALGNKLYSSDLVANGISLPYAGFNGNVGQALRPFPQYSNLQTPSDIEDAGHTSFNAMIASLNHRTRYGLTFDVAYTWSKTITNADSAIGGINGGISALIQDPYNLKTGKSLSIQDIPNNFVVNYLYELPVGNGKLLAGHANRLVNSVIGGWTVGGIQRYLSGVPISFSCASGVGNAGIFNNCFSFTQLPGTSLSSGLKKGQVKPFEYLLNTSIAGPDPKMDSIFNGLQRAPGDNSAYAALQPSPALYDQNQNLPARRNGGAFTFGNLPRVTGGVRNFGYLQEDFVVIKNIPLIQDKVSFQFKVEALNAFNRHNFNPPNTNPYSNSFGVPTSVAGGATDSQRRLQLNGRITF